MNLKKILPAVAVLVGTSIGSVGGYYYREAQTSPALQSLSAALELVTGREAAGASGLRDIAGQIGGCFRTSYWRKKRSTEGNS